MAREDCIYIMLFNALPIKIQSTYCFKNLLEAHGWNSNWGYLWVGLIIGTIFLSGFLSFISILTEHVLVWSFEKYMRCLK